MCLGDIITSIEGGALVQINLARFGFYIKEKAYALIVVISLCEFCSDSVVAGSDETPIYVQEKWFNLSLSA